MLHRLLECSTTWWIKWGAYYISYCIDVRFELGIWVVGAMVKHVVNQTLRNVPNHSFFFCFFPSMLLTLIYAMGMIKSDQIILSELVCRWTERTILFCRFTRYGGSRVSVLLCSMTKICSVCTHETLQLQGCCFVVRRVRIAENLILKKNMICPTCRIDSPRHDPNYSRFYLHVPYSPWCEAIGWNAVYLVSQICSSRPSTVLQGLRSSLLAKTHIFDSVMCLSLHRWLHHSHSQ